MMETLIASPIFIEVFIAIVFSAVIYLIAKKWSDHTVTALGGHMTELKEEIKKSNETNDKILQEMIIHNKVSDETIKLLRELQLGMADGRRDHQEILKEILRKDKEV